MPEDTPKVEAIPVKEAEVPKTRSLVRKLCEVMAAVERVAKTGYNEFHKYEYAKEADLVEAIRGELAKRQIFIFPNVLKNDRTQITIQTYKGERSTAITDIMVEWTFVDGESGETWAINIAGCGEDSVDKGFYKAFTGSEKYMLMKSFLIPTGDDPERDDKAELRAAKERGKEDAQAVAREKIAAHDGKRLETAPNANVGTPGAVSAMFYTLPNGDQPGSYALIVGPEGMLKLYKDTLLKIGRPQGKGKGVLIPIDALADLQYQLEQSGFLLRRLEVQK